jgi:hypothetical protein
MLPGIGKRPTAEILRDRDLSMSEYDQQLQTLELRANENLPGRNLDQLRGRARRLSA